MKLKILRYIFGGVDVKVTVQTESSSAAYSEHQEESAIEEFESKLNSNISIKKGEILVGEESSIRIREDIFSEISGERDYQDSRWGIEFDDKNTINDWITYINRYMAKAGTFGASKEVQRTALLKAITIGVAALETFDRNEKFAPRHYDGEDLQ
jgi:hypothetical protein